jgi:hypothetical protein
MFISLVYVVGQGLKVAANQLYDRSKVRFYSLSIIEDDVGYYHLNTTG